MQPAEPLPLHCLSLLLEFGPALLLCPAGYKSYLGSILRSEPEKSVLLHANLAELLAAIYYA